MAPQKNSSNTTEPATTILPASVHPSSRQTNEPQSGSNPAINNGNSSHSAGQPKPSTDASLPSKKQPMTKPATDGHGNGAIPASTHSSPGATASDRPVTEVIAEGFTPFDHQHLVVGPFTEESNRDAAFEQELAALLLDAIIETHAWAAARPKYESQLAVQNLESKISDVIEVEKIQEETRERVNDFVVRMKTALAALTGL